MNRFSFARFRRVFANDFLQQWRKVWMATLGTVAVALVIYVMGVDPRADVVPPPHATLFPMILLVAGLIFTSTIFSDLHHPLQRFHYLTLPCSNLERFVSRYLLSGPLLLVYVLVVYTLFDWVAGGVSELLKGARAQPFPVFTDFPWEHALRYFGAHAVMFAGAIYFRSHVFFRTTLFVAVIVLGLLLVQLVALRILFRGHFTSLFEIDKALDIEPFSVPPSLAIGGWILLGLWILCIAFVRLREHEVQREL